jgi:ATP-binding cassette subfamily C protein
MMVVLLYGSVVVGGQPFSAVLMIGFIFYRLAAYIGLTQTYYQLVTSKESAFWSLRDSMHEAEAAREPLRSGGARPGLQHALCFENVSFSYGSAPVLRDVDLRIPAGAFVVLMGPSGEGKTTLIDLIVGLYEPDAGRITVDGVPLPDMDLLAWRDRVGYVPQEMFLFHDTVLHNVTLGNDRLTREAAREALELAGAWEFVASLPEGLDTVVGERGTTLSGGERQRVAVARALARRPVLLLLDEATTSLDPDTERRLCANLGRLRGETTVVAISHQPAVAELADAAFRFDRGTVHAMAQHVTG